MMAAFIGHVLSTDGSKILANFFKSSLIPCRFQCRKKKIKALPKRYVRNAPIQGRVDSMSYKGFLRNIVSYTPPDDASDRLGRWSVEVVGSSDPNHKINDNQKYQLLSVLAREFNYIVPNSLLHKMDNLGSVFTFYMAPVDTIVPYDKFKETDLPPNLHVIQDYHRFHPDTDTKFGGVSAFPRSSTIVTGLTHKKKYSGYDAGNPWSDI